MTEEVEGTSATPTQETPSLSPAERIARLLSKEDGGGQPDGEGEKPTPETKPDAEGTATSESASTEKTEKAVEATPVDLTSRHKVKVDGQEVEVTLEDALKSYSFTAHNTRTAQKLAEDRKAFEKEQADARELTNTYRTVLPKLEAMAKRAVDEFADVDWEKLRREDPATFAEARAAYQLQQERLAAVTSERESEDRKKAEEDAAEHARYTQVEHESLLAKIPEWRDDNVRAEETGKIAEFAVKTLGFTPEDLANLYDHRAIMGLRMAYKGSLVMSKAEEAAKKVAEARKTTDSSARKVEDSSESSERLSNARARLRKSGRDRDAADAFTAFLDKQDGK